MNGRKRRGERAPTRPDRWVASLAIGLVAVQTGCASEVQRTELTLEDVVEQAVEAQGGAEALARIETVVRQRSERLFTVRKRPDRLLVVLLNDAGGVLYAEGFDGQAAWQMIDDGPKELEDERARTALWHTTQFPGELMPLSSLAEHGHRLQLMGVDTLEEREYIHLRLTLGDGFQRAYYLDPTTYRIARARDVRRLHAYEEEVQPIESVWGEYRQVEGVWVPFASGERNYETGEQLSDGQMRDVRINVSLPDDVFSVDGSLQLLLDYIASMGGGPP